MKTYEGMYAGNRMGEVCRAIQELIAGTEWEGQVYVAGGFVRDLLLLRERPKDLDLVVTLPDGGVRFAEWLCHKVGCYVSDANPVVYPRFGTAKFNLRGTPWAATDIECVMPRTEVYADGSRRPSAVGFASLEEDAQRRDFTINALYINLSTGTLIDFVDGIKDIRDRHLRTSLDSSVIYADDPLRMLRAVRFAANLNMVPSPDIVAGVMERPARVLECSQERIAEELSKMIQGPMPILAIGLLQQWGMLAHVLPELEACVGVGQGRHHDEDVFWHSVNALDYAAVLSDDPVTRWAALLHDVGKPSTRTVLDGNIHFLEHEEVGVQLVRRRMEALRFPNAVIDPVVVLIRSHMRLKQSGPDGSSASDKVLRKVRAAVGDYLPQYLDLLAADNAAHAPGSRQPEQVPGLRARFEALAIAAPRLVLPVDGKEIMEALGIGPGPHVGRCIAAVKEAWFENPQITKEDALEIVRSVE